MYSYKSKNDDIAKDEIDIKDIESIDIEPDDERVFYLTYKIYAYKLEAESKVVWDKWVKSLELIVSKSKDYLNLNWFVGKDIFTKVTTESLFLDYEVILER